MQKIINYTFLISPLLVTSLFIYGSQYPAWANTLFLALLLAFAMSIFNIVKNKISNKSAGKGINTLSFILNGAGLLAFALFALFGSQKLSFNLFGKGIAEMTAISILGLFVVASFFISNKKYNKLAVAISALTIFYTLINFALIKYAPAIAGYTGYANIPMISFAKLLNYPLIFSLVVFVSSLIAFVIEKKGYVFSNIKESKIVNYTYILISIFLFLGLSSYTLRYYAAHNYLKASEEYRLGDIDKAKESINRAIIVAPFDTYYLGRIEIISSDIQKLLSSTSTDKVSLQNKYKELVERQITDAKKAVDYDDQNPANFIALGNAYERSMLLTKDDGYKLAIEAYEKARTIADDKDYVDVVKAKLSFSAEKEKDALASLDRAFRYNASSAPALYLSSQYYTSKNNLKSAVEYGEKTVAAAPAAVDARMHLGTLYAKAGNTDGAIQLFGSAFALSKQTNNVALYYLGLLYKEKKDIKNLDLVIQELEKRLGANIKEIQDLKQN